MASSRGEPESWSTKARRQSAENPDAPQNLEPTGPLFDPLEGTFAPPIAPGESVGKRPTPAPRDGARRRERPPENVERDEDTIYAPPRRRVPPPARRPRRSRQVRRVRRTLRHIDPLSVLKVSLMFYGVFLIIWLGIVAVIYWIVQSLGVFETINDFMEVAAVKGNFELSLSLVEKWAFFIGLTVAVVMALVNLFLAFLYNVIADTIGGIDMTFVERDS